MYVCVCNAVTERQVHQAVRNGAKTVKDLKEQLGVGAECGKCASCAKACLKEAHTEQHPGLVKKLIQLTPVQLGAA
ncbi:bacterioferritin-associated ferredoxin [Methylophilus rhizosphaerae]|uniref:Bacterioferritin-associated ferredoxin n=1 Tax=Methylophilus rhizosphaerae TaxID=492660 RepID=A0A1G9D4Y7_9PROT|nr:(2Fe-2S)-binding protein [Methylophilus rhizosphaerae]SDK58754.1 bacterioferritin-associated ferredoxin [Methylophilus rhizosphaerae]